MVFLEQNRLFERLGWRVVPFAMHHSSNLESGWSEYFIEALEFADQYSLLQKLKRVPKVIYSLEARAKIGNLLDRISPDVCHLHNVYHHISPSILGVLKKRGVPTVMTLHDLKLACPSYNMLAADGICERCKGGQLINVVKHRCIKNSIALSSLVYVESKIHRLLDIYSKNVDRFIVPSRFLLAKMVEWGLDRTKLVHIPNFVSDETQPTCAPLGRRFIYFGRLAPEKGVATLIRATALAGVSLNVVGAGREESSLRALAEDLGADVKFCGYQSGDALRQLIRGSRASVLPSELYENAPMSVLEAYSHGVPAIGANIGGIPELIKHGVTGAIFESSSVNGLANVLRQFADLPDERIREMGLAGRAFVASQFSSDLYLQRLLGLYRELGVAC